MPRNTHWRCSIQKAVFKNLAIFIGKRLCWSLFSLKLFQYNSCEYCEIFKNTYFEEHLRTAASEYRQEWRTTFACWTGWNGVRYNYIFYLFVSFWYCYICILSRSSRTEVFFKKMFLKISQNSLFKHL